MYRDAHGCMDRGYVGVDMGSEGCIYRDAQGMSGVSYSCKVQIWTREQSATGYEAHI